MKIRLLLFWPVWPDDRIIFQYFNFYKCEHFTLPIIIIDNVDSKCCQILTSPKNQANNLIFCQGGEIFPNLVTLFTSYLGLNGKICFEKKVLKNRTLEQKIVCYLPHTFELTSMYLLRCQMYQFVQWQNAWCQSFVEPRPTPYFSPLYSNDANCKNVKKVELVLWMRIYSPDIAS